MESARKHCYDYFCLCNVVLIWAVVAFILFAVLTTAIVLVIVL